MKYKVLFRCDAANIKGVGSGHLIRCIVIAKILQKKFGLKKKEILFITKSKKKYNLSIRILNKYRYNYLTIDYKNSKNKEIKLLSKFESKLLIIDKYKFFSDKYYSEIIKNFKKVIFIDSYKKSFKNVYYLNPTFYKKKDSNSSTIIIPSLLEQKNKTNTKKKIKNIFLYFGEFDFNNLGIRVVEILQKIGGFNIYSNIKNKFNLKNCKNIKFVNKKNFFKSIKNSDLVISSGGLIMYDVMNLNKPLIVIPQIKHQDINSEYYKKKKCLIKVSIGKNLDEILVDKIRLINNSKLRETMIYNQKKIFSNKNQKKIYSFLKNVFGKN